MEITLPTPKQLENTTISGWEYLEDGLFVKGDVMGYFTEDGGWYVE
jgi:hypothetical protein